MMSTPRSAMRLASSCTVMTSGITTSRWIFSCACGPVICFFWRSWRRFSEARLRWRCSSSSALMMVSRPRTALLAATRRGNALLVPGIGGAGGLLGLLLGQVLAGGLFADLARLGLGLMPLVFFAFTLFGLFPLLGPLIFGHYVQRGRLLGLLGSAASRWREFGERAHARVLLLLGELRQHNASLARRRIVLNGLLHGFGGARSRLWRRRLLDGLRRATRADRPALLFLHQDGLRAAMAEALAHMAGFHRPAHVESHFAPAASGLVFSLVGLTHSLSVSDPFWLANVLHPLR